jgi:hypothetical protein
VAFILSRASGTALLWIARPAANAILPPVTTTLAIVELVIGFVAALWTGWHAPLLLVLAAATVRIVMAVSYRVWGGIRIVSLLTVRIVVAVAGIVIARLPESSLYFGAR